MQTGCGIAVVCFTQCHEIGILVVLVLALNEYAFVAETDHGYSVVIVLYERRNSQTE